jgi:biotin carboxylase
VRPTLLLLVGTRGIRITDTVNPLRSVGDVVVVTSSDILADRADTLDAGLPATVAVAATRDDLVEHAAATGAQHLVDGVLTFSDDLVEAAAVVADRLGLPGQPPASMAGYRDKYVQRCRLAAAGVPTPRFALLTSPDDAAAAADQVPLPAILKPTRGSGGAFAYVVRAAEELPGVAAEAFGGTARAGGAVDPGSAFILEELLVGSSWHETTGFAPYVSVESVGAGGSVRHLAITDRFPTAPPVLETGMMLPSSLDEGQCQDVLAMADRALRALEFSCGLAHTELMLTAAGPRVIEVNGRAGGALPYLFPMASDLDLIAQAGRAALGLEPPAAPTFDRHAVFVSPQHPVGVEVEKVEGLDDVRALPGVRAVIPIAAGSGHTHAFRGTLIAAVLGSVDSPGEAVALWDKVMSTVRPRYHAPSASAGASVTP